jgi:CheY-specific phosphatase CheX
MMKKPAAAALSFHVDIVAPSLLSGERSALASHDFVAAPLTFIGSSPSSSVSNMDNKVFNVDS